MGRGGRRLNKMPTSVKVIFGGGLEGLFFGRPSLDVVLTARDEQLSAPTIAELLHELCQKHFDQSQRLDHFVRPVDEKAAEKVLTVRAGVLVLVNDVDWELEDGLGTLLHPNDTVTFISTLHGG